MRKFLCFISILALAVSCQMFNSLIHDEEIVARVGNHKLYLSDLQKYIPDYVSSDDSSRLAQQFINKWATDAIYLDMAESQLTEEELDVTKELESYRQSLLKYRYEQRYISDRLDTLITDTQIEDYYKSHQDAFVITRPIVRYRFLDAAKSCPNKDQLIKKMSSSDPRDYEGLDSLALRTALRYYDRSEVWTDIIVLAKEFDTDYRTLEKKIKDSRIRITDSDTGEERIAYICEIRNSGIAPLEYCREDIISIIHNSRKHDLLVTLEQDLLKDALEQQKFEIYK